MNGLETYPEINVSTKCFDDIVENVDSRTRSLVKGSNTDQELLTESEILSCS